MRNELDGYPIAFQNYIMQHPEEINRAGDISAAFTEWQLPTVNGQQYYSAPDQSTDGTWASTIGNSQITLPDGRTAIPNDIATSIAEQTNQGDWLQNILNSSLPVMALGGALGAYGAFGPQGFAGNLFGGGLPSAPTDFSGATFGNGPGIGGNIIPTGADVGDISSMFGPSPDGYIQGAGETASGIDAASYANPYADLGPSPEGYIPGTNETASGIDAASYSAASPTSYGSFGPSPNGYVPGANETASGIDEASYKAALSGGSALSKLFPNATGASALTGLGQGLLGYLGAQQQTKALSDMQDKYLALGAPYRDKLAATYQPGYSVFDDSATKDAATRAADVAARSYSATSGNPFDQPSAQGGIYNSVLSGVALPQLNTTRSQLGSFGQLGINTAGTAGLGAAQQAGGGLDAVGYGLGTALNGQPSIQDLLKQAGNYKFTAGA